MDQKKESSEKQKKIHETLWDDIKQGEGGDDRQS